MTATEQALTDLRKELEAGARIIAYALTSSEAEQKSALYLVRSDLRRLVGEDGNEA